VIQRNQEVFGRTLRATFFRWATRIETLCPELRNATQVLSVGDTHTENFGTWRDAEGRLVWGINDFDECAVIPYPFDLVRLAASARLAPKPIARNRDVAAAILEGYRKGLSRPRPTLLDEQETWMRPYVVISDDDRREFWDEVADYPDTVPPAIVADGLKKTLPENASIVRFATRVKGGGGLGRPRYVAIARWRGGRIVREAKALVPSAWNWAHNKASSRLRFLDLAKGAFRSPDPFLALQSGFLFRRIAADSRKVELGDNAGAKLKLDLLRAMGFDLGAIHSAEGAAKTISADLSSRPADWLHSSAKIAAAEVEKDFDKWTG
jgi:Uncharacterized protein conserved in bacteria (DUF2252)